MGALAQGADHVILVDELELGGNLEVAAAHGAGTIDRDGGRGLVARAHGTEHQALDVEHDVGDVLVDALDGGELVLDAVNLDGLDCRTLEGGEQHATKGVTEGVAVATLQRLSADAGDVLGNLLDRHLRSDEF